MQNNYAEQTSCLKEFARYTSLNVLGMIGLSCYILADTFFVAKGLGTSGLAALNLAIPVYSFIHGSGLMFGIGGATKFSISRKSGLSDLIFTNTLFFAGITPFCSSWPDCSCPRRLQRFWALTARWPQ